MSTAWYDRWRQNQHNNIVSEKSAVVLVSPIVKITEVKGLFQWKTMSNLCVYYAVSSRLLTTCVQPLLSMTLSHQISYIFSSTRAKQRSPAIFMSVCLSISATLSRLATVVVGMEKHNTDGTRISGAVYLPGNIDRIPWKATEKCHSALCYWVSPNTSCMQIGLYS